MAPENRRIVAAIRREVSFAKPPPPVKAGVQATLRKVGEIVPATLCQDGFLG
jgi:hypothetical protein